MSYLKTKKAKQQKKVAKVKVLSALEEGELSDYQKGKELYSIQQEEIKVLKDVYSK